MEIYSSLRRRLVVGPAPLVSSTASCQCMGLKIQVCCPPGSPAFPSVTGLGALNLHGSDYGREAFQSVQTPAWMRGPLLALVLLAFIMSAHADSYKARPLAMSIKAEYPLNDLSVLDPRIQRIAFQALQGRRIKTGTVYNAIVPADLGNITVQAVRLRAGSFRVRGYTFNEFVFPIGVRVTPYYERVVLVYRNLGNDTAYAPSIPAGYASGQVIGVLAYSAANLSTTEALPELTVVAPPSDPIVIRFRSPLPIPEQARCAALNNSLPTTAPVVSSTDSTGACTAGQAGDFTLLLPGPSPSPPPSPPPNPSPSPSSSSDTWKKVVGGIVGGAVGLALIVLLALLGVIIWQRRRISNMHKASEQGPTLQTAEVGSSRAPAAASTRTGPSLENEYVA